MTTRIFFCALLSAAALSSAALRANETGAVGKPLPPWQPGNLDIHQISTGRGNSTFIIAPDGTSLMIDAGATANGLDVSSPSKPDASRRPGEWIARYAQRHALPTGRTGLDYFVVSHFHPDHLGDIAVSTTASANGPYQLTGVTDVAELLAIKKVIDRDYPDYNYPTRWRAGFALNYFTYIDGRNSRQLATEKARVGAIDQIQLAKPEAFPTFAARIIAANGVVWAGDGENVHRPVPSLSELSPADYPDENMCAIALRISYGKFDYYNGSDLAHDTRQGDQPWRDLETPVARAAGAVEVAVANHHGYFDSMGVESIRALQPQVFVIPAWHITHPNIAQLERMLSERIYPGPRDVFATDLMPANQLINARFIPKLKSTAGHIVVRVSPGGDEFRVFVTDNSDERDLVKAVFGPYRSK